MLPRAEIFDDIKLRVAPENTLASVLDKCVTPMGSRLLKRWIHQPIRDVEKEN